MSDMEFRIAVVQAAPVYLDLRGSLDKAIALIEEAGAGGARLVAFPECWMPGYPWWLWLGAPAWGLQFVPRYHANAMRVDGEEMSALQEAAARAGVHVLMGFTEIEGGSLYMAQALIDERGELVYARRKLKPTHVERSLFGEGDGSDFRVARTAIGNVGSLCCWEHLQPLSKYAMYAMQEQIHIASWPAFTLYRGQAYALGHEVNLAASRVYAVEGGCYVLAACAVNGQDVFDLLCDTDERAEMLNPGSGKPGGGFSMIYAPDGRELCEHLAEDEEGILYANISLPMIAVAKAAADPVGHYARPDVTRLLLDRTRRRPVVGPDDVHGRTDAAAAMVGRPDELGSPSDGRRHEADTPDGTDRRTLDARGDESVGA